MNNSNFLDRFTVADLKDADTRVLTIESARRKSFGKNYLDGGDEKLVLNFKEVPDKEYVLNSTSYGLLVDRYGKDYNTWLGQPCVLKRTETNDPSNGAKVVSAWVAAPRVWEIAIRGEPRTAVTPTRRPRTPRKRS
jgi:hypothetical protein